MEKKTLKANLSVSSIQNLQHELERYKTDIEQKCNLFAERLAQEGVSIVKMNIGVYDAIYTGELMASINYEQGSVIQHGSKWIIYTNCSWAQFVEFGTGIVGEQNQHPITSIIGWKYDVNDHGEKGWFYFKDGEWHWTKGMPSRPIFYEAAMELRQNIVRTAKEVFGT